MHQPGGNLEKTMASRNQDAPPCWGTREEEARQGSRGFPRKAGIKHEGCHRGVILKDHVEENFYIFLWKHTKKKDF